MLKRLLIIAVMAFLSISSNFPQQNSSSHNPSLKIVEQHQDMLKIEWQNPEIVLDQVTVNDLSRYRLSFDQCNYIGSGGNYQIPYKRFSLGVPENAKVSCQLSEVVYESRENIVLPLISEPGRDKNGMSISVEPSGSQEQNFTEREVVEISDQVYFRDMPMVHIDFYPIRYDPVAKTIRIIKSATSSASLETGLPLVTHSDTSPSSSAISAIR